MRDGDDVSIQADRAAKWTLAQRDTFTGGADCEAHQLFRSVHSELFGRRSSVLTYAAACSIAGTALMNASYTASSQKRLDACISAIAAAHGMAPR
jgi:hypothetical protein